MSDGKRASSRASGWTRRGPDALAPCRASRVGSFLRRQSRASTPRPLQLLRGRVRRGEDGSPRDGEGLHERATGLGKDAPCGEGMGALDY